MERRCSTASEVGGERAAAVPKQAGRMMSNRTIVRRKIKEPPAELLTAAGHSIDEKDCQA
jgi:hypothetical protein